MKADKLRQVANKYVRDLNDPVMDSNLQVCPSFAVVSGVLFRCCCRHNLLYIIRRGCVWKLSVVSLLTFFLRLIGV